MKKVLTILTVLVLLAGVVFADPIATPGTSATIPTTGTDETHTITVNTWVDVTLPVFSFKVDDRVSTNSSKDVFDGANAFTVTDTAYIRGNSDIARVGNDIANSDISENFTIYSVSKSANIVKAFDFTVTATYFTHAADVNGPYHTTEAAGDRVITYAPETVAATEHISAELKTANDNTSGMTVTFSGKQANDNVLLGTVTVTWPQDVNAVPGAYTADVQLTITAK